MKKINDQEELERIKKNINRSFNYFKKNYENYHKFKKFVFVTTLDDNSINLLNALKRPVLEFNVSEAYISRLLGEFSKQVPSIKVSAEEGFNQDPAQIDMVDGYFRHVYEEFKRKGYSYNTMKDLLAGGFSVLEVQTYYPNNKSFDQDILIKKLDPTRCGFDPVAELRGKGDGRYCYKITPVTKEDAKKYNINTDEINFYRSDNIGEFRWSYNNQEEEILMVADYYEKVIEEKELLLLEDQTKITREEYNNIVKKLKSVSYINPDYEKYIPKIISSRKIEKTKIFRTRIIENKIIERIETIYKSLPLVFVDGNSEKYRDSLFGEEKQCTKPLAYNIEGAQKLKNYAGQSLANELENTVQHKFIASKESLPSDPVSQEAYKNVQTASLLIYNAFKDNNPDIPLQPPREVARIPAPPEITNTFVLADKMIQNILGSYDASLGINDNQLSGVALREGATHSNAAAMPFIIGYLQGVTDSAQIIKELMPLVHTTNRSLPGLSQDNTKTHIKINNPETGNIKLNYDPADLKIIVEAGLDFETQKSNTIKNIVELSNAMPILSEFFNSKALPIIVENLTEIRGGDGLKILAKQFMAEKQQAANAPKQPDPITAQLLLEQEHLKLKEQQNKTETAIKSAQIELDAYGKETERMKLSLNEKQRQKENTIKIDKHQSEKARTMAELAIKSADLMHNHNKDHHNQREKYMPPEKKE